MKDWWLIPLFSMVVIALILLVRDIQNLLRGQEEHPDRKKQKKVLAAHPGTRPVLFIPFFAA